MSTPESSLLEISQTAVVHLGVFRSDDNNLFLKDSRSSLQHSKS